jgi:hypothetical protein
MATAGQLADQGAPRAAGRANDHVQLVITVHGRLLGSVHREPGQGTGRGPGVSGSVVAQFSVREVSMAAVVIVAAVAAGAAVSGVSPSSRIRN